MAVNRNVRVDDDPVMRYVPYFGDDDVTSVDVSAYDVLDGACESSADTGCIDGA